MVVTVNTYLKAAQPCHRDFQKALQGVYALEERSHETTTVTKQAARISDDDFDAHTEDYASDKGEDNGKVVSPRGEDEVHQAHSRWRL
ncbi:hypothetical protein P8452_56045 [Trifolium repens]|nr:hypothetical protein P8452_56045 [Trifolium repens]